jgi:hypothetical protein
MNSASLCSLAGRYDNPIPTRCLAPIDFLKIPPLVIQHSLRILRSPGIDSQPGELVRQPSTTFWPAGARICKPFKEPKNRFPAWHAGTTSFMTYRHARLHRLAEAIPGLLERLQIRVQQTLDDTLELADNEVFYIFP